MTVAEMTSPSSSGCTELVLLLCCSFGSQIVKMTLDDSRESMDNFVFCLANRKVITRMQKDVQDLVGGRLL